MKSLCNLKIDATILSENILLFQRDYFKNTIKKIAYKNGTDRSVPSIVKREFSFFLLGMTYTECNSSASENIK